MSGEVANGVYFPAGNREFYNYAISSFHKAYKAAGRSDPFYIVLNANISVADDSSTALEAIRPLVADSILHRAENEHSLKHMGITYSQAIAWHSDPASIPEEVLRESAIVGTPDECIEGLDRLKELGVTQVVIRFPEESIIHDIGKRLLPKVKAHESN
jgi:alkanesulfonate monooxygenase SsuD/methylene tetrahydromethanopterin reductase-like flavin-dependent oxidoreductase (luciferase family)